MTQQEWQLHPQLAQDCFGIGELPLCRLLLMNDANYPWLILVPRRPDLTEITELAPGDRSELMAEMVEVAAEVKSLTGCHKLNVAALGNAVPQLHIHVVARFRTDPAWPKPVWGQVPARPYTEAKRDRMVEALRRALGRKMS
jgi:diadenosine tetraphosphate (Ap4A) HIT family hydrolase